MCWFSIHWIKVKIHCWIVNFSIINFSSHTKIAILNLQNDNTNYEARNDCDNNKTHRYTRKISIASTLDHCNINHTQEFTSNVNTCKVLQSQNSTSGRNLTFGTPLYYWHQAISCNLCVLYYARICYETF